MADASIAALQGPTVLVSRGYESSEAGLSQYVVGCRFRKITVGQLNYP